ncbi:MAG: 2OG-Fe(II) oxygenase [Bacteroidia bacterium]|nr:2OG-Fe(II) oxygenase [Bacteroidia bacterium]
MLNSSNTNLQDLGTQLASKYQTNKPYPSIYIDDFFDENILEKVLEEFPKVDQLKDKIYYANPNEDKYATKGEYSFGPQTKKLVHFLNSQPFLEFLQKITGIEETLIPDPYFEGGGFHEIKPGGFLKVHVDFHKNKKLQLSRRVNFLVYLNKDWEEEYGGHLELWEKDMSQCVSKILPKFNRAAMFSTTGDSWHGHPNPLSCPEGKSRKSLALYYYTNGRPEEELNKSQRNRITTTFSNRKGIDSNQMKYYNKLVNLANRIIPNFLIEKLKAKRNK